MFTFALQKAHASRYSTLVQCCPQNYTLLTIRPIRLPLRHTFTPRVHSSLFVTSHASPSSTPPQQQALRQLQMRQQTLPPLPEQRTVTT